MIAISGSQIADRGGDLGTGCPTHLLKPKQFEELDQPKKTFAYQI